MKNITAKSRHAGFSRHTQLLASAPNLDPTRWRVTLVVVNSRDALVAEPTGERTLALFHGLRAGARGLRL